MSNWDTFQKSTLRYPELGFALDTSRMDAPAEWPPEMQEKIAGAFRDRAATEAGEIMNPDEVRPPIQSAMGNRASQPFEIA